MDKESTFKNSQQSATSTCLWTITSPAKSMLSKEFEASKLSFYKGYFHFIHLTLSQFHFLCYSHRAVYHRKTDWDNEKEGILYEKDLNWKKLLNWLWLDLN